MIRQGAVVKVVPYGTITMRQNGGGELSDMAAMRDEVVGFSDDGRGVQEDAVMEAAMREAARLGKPDSGPLRGEFPAARRIYTRR